MTVDLAESVSLAQLAEEIHAEVQRGRDGLTQAMESYFAIGHRLLAARRQLITDNDFGSWLRAQDFGFSQPWAWYLRKAADHETLVRPVVISQLMTGRPNIEKAVRQILAANGDGRGEQPAPPVGTYAAVVIDPPWSYSNVATRGAAADHYPTMTVDELEQLDIPSAPNSHLYLWVTNGFLREGLDLLEVWGYRYKTTLTWCKPQIGMGNWFRNSTEHVLFAVKGSLATLRNDVPTWFKADRTQHSAKPESFYDLVESCSPGPWLEMFARRRRLGWETWGNEA